MRPLNAAFLAMGLLVLALFGWDLLDGRPPMPVSSAAGTAGWPQPAGAAALAVSDNPVQEAVALPPLEYRGYRLEPQARFRIAARLLGRESYNFGREADLSPVDFALGWGPMASDAVLATIEISQSNRFFFWKTPAYPIPREEIERHATNVHIIPADNTVAAQIDRIEVDDRVRLGGYLVNVANDDGWHWNTSLSRDDTGKGACELFYVDSVSVLP